VSIVRDFVTAGSPIRKYIDLFAWGEKWNNRSQFVTPIADILKNTAPKSATGE